MIKMLLWFLLITASVAGIITVVQSMTSMEKWSVVKTIGFGVLCATITIVFLTTIVVLF